MWKKGKEFPEEGGNRILLMINHEFESIMSLSQLKQAERIIPSSQ